LKSNNLQQFYAISLWHLEKRQRKTDIITTLAAAAVVAADYQFLTINSSKDKNF